jgi:hypothetical protein
MDTETVPVSECRSLLHHHLPVSHNYRRDLFRFYQHTNKIQDRGIGKGGENGGRETFYSATSHKTLYALLSTFSPPASKILLYCLRLRPRLLCIIPPHRTPRITLSLPISFLLDCPTVYKFSFSIPHLQNIYQYALQWRETLPQTYLHGVPVSRCGRTYTYPFVSLNRSDYISMLTSHSRRIPE